MGKKGVSRISGPNHPTIGQKVIYKVAEWYPSTPLNERNSDKITWELFRKRNDGKFTTTNIKKKGIGNFTFTENAENFTYKIEGYLHRPEGKEPMAIIVHPQKSKIQKDKTKEILGIALTHQDGSKITKPLSYMDRLKAVAKCKNMVGEKIVFTLWEDDEKRAGHNAKNQYIAKSKEIIVDSKGNARWDFALFNTYIKLANLKEDDTKQHEYYVMIEYDKKPTASQNVNINNPEHKNKPTQKPKPKPDSAKGSSNSNSKNNQPDKKGEVSSVKLLNAKKTPITKATFGDTIYVQIKGSNLDKKKYSLKIWEDDDFGKNDLLYIGEHIFSTNTYQEVKVILTDEFRKIGEIGNDPKNPDKGEYLTGNYQEIFAEVELLTQVTKSAIIEVSLNAKATPPEQTIAAAVIGKLDKKKEENTTCVCKQYDLIWGNKLTCSQRKKVVEACKRLWGENKKIEKANELMAIIHLETGGTFSPSKKGVTKTGARFIGLIQFRDSTAESLKTTYDKLDKMTFIEQMDYVEAYLKKNIEKMKTITDFYLQVLKPSSVGNGDNPNHVVFDESISVPDGNGNNTSQSQRDKNITIEPWATKYGYSSNPLFMLEKDEKIKRKRWAYTRQQYEDRYGSINGKTYVWEIEKILKDKNYSPGESNKYNGICDNEAEEIKNSDGKYPSWVEIAIKEEAKIIRESTHCSYIINTYHASTDNAKMKRCGSENDAKRENAAWCGAFVAYCLKTSGHKYQPDPGAIWHGKENLVKRDKNGAPSETQEKWGKKYPQMYIGGIVVWHNNGHTTIIVGIDKSNPKNYILLGGNQDNGVRFWTCPKSKVQAYCIFPIDYKGELLPLELIEPSELSANAVKYNEGSTS